ncbi:hypothetical protein BGX27_011270 [Mortierella sp. AM989]|nr:hypothetical protein BGX27_011270 [Mortierella sp. AM989]
MRPTAIRRVLTGPHMRLAFRIEQALHAKASDNIWQLCFQRAYSRSMLSKDRQVTTTCWPTRSSLEKDASSCLLMERHSLRRHSRPYASAATTTAARSPTKSTSAETSIGSILKPVPNPVSIAATPGQSRKPKIEMKQMRQAIVNKDLTTAYSTYHFLRRLSFFREILPLWYWCQCRLVQLLHYARLELLSSDQDYMFSKQLKLLDKQRRTILKDISERTLKNNNKAQSMAKLVNALGKSKAMIQHSYKTDSDTKLHDWREALKVLESWAAFDPLWITASTGGHSNTDEDMVREPRADVDTEPKPQRHSRNNPLDRELATWLAKLMRRLAYSHTFLVRSMLDTIPDQYGIQPTIEMYTALLEYYAMLGKDGSKGILDIVDKMTSQDIAWDQEPIIYDYLLYALSHQSGNIPLVDKILERMLENDLVPKEETLKAIILCAARSGDIQTCSRYIQRMHHDWNLNITERMKAILLYACAKRGDFEGALEILGQLGRSGTLVRSRHGTTKTHHNAKDMDTTTSTSASPNTSASKMEELLTSQDVINNSNILLALINQTHLRRGGKRRITQEFVKEEVSKVLELFTVITRDPDQVDTQLYTIMMQYLSSLPSPLPGMMYLYNEMCASENAKPNNVTYRIMLESCAEQMDMDQGKQLWDDLTAAKIPKDSYIRASYVKGWGRTGRLDIAEWIAREGLLDQEQLEKDRMQHHIIFAMRNKKRRARGLPALEKLPRLPKRQRTTEVINLTVLHQLMKAHRQHNNPGRVFELYKEIEAGKWGRKISPTGFTLSIVLGACASGSASPELVDQSIKLVDQVIEMKRQQRQQYSKDDDIEDANEDQDKDGGNEDEAKPDGPLHQRQILELLGSESASEANQLPILSEVNYQLYFTMLGRHHRQHKIVEAWEDMMRTIENPPPPLTVNLVTEALENVQWGAAPIKRIQRQLGEVWPNVDWARVRQGTVSSGGPGSIRIEVDDTVGAGGRFWR